MKSNEFDLHTIDYCNPLLFSLRTILCSDVLTVLCLFQSLILQVMKKMKMSTRMPKQVRIFTILAEM